MCECVCHEDTLTVSPRCPGVSSAWYYFFTAIPATRQHRRKAIEKNLCKICPDLSLPETSESEQSKNYSPNTWSEARCVCLKEIKI